MGFRETVLGEIMYGRAVFAWTKLGSSGGETAKTGSGGGCPPSADSPSAQDSGYLASPATSDKRVRNFSLRGLPGWIV